MISYAYVVNPNLTGSYGILSTPDNAVTTSGWGNGGGSITVFIKAQVNLTPTVKIMGFG